MTLCVAWKWEDPHGSKICLAADTCITLGDRQMPYGGVKVFTLPIHYQWPRLNDQHGSWQATYGLAFSGSYLHIFVLKELLAEVLTGIQGTREATEVTFDDICRFIAKFHTHFHEDISQHLKVEHELDFILAGLCPATNRLRAASFRITGGKSAFQEVLTGAGEKWTTLGVPRICARFTELLKLNLSAPPCRIHFAMFRRLRDLIVDSKEPSIAGAIQYGSFEGNQFTLAGTGMLTVSDHGPVVKAYHRGTEIDAVHKPESFDDFLVASSLVVPFNEDIAAYDTSAYWEGPHRNTLDELITVLPHDSGWRADFLRESWKLRWFFGAWPIEHIGSTAVPGLSAVPTIDILVGKVMPKPLNLRKHGYRCVGPGPLDSVIYRKRVKKLSINVYVARQHSPFWTQSLGLRAFLRAQEAEAKAYGIAKLKILNAGSWLLSRYTAEKRPALEGLNARANL